VTRVEFIKLKRPERARILCELAEEFQAAGRRVLVMVKDENQGLTLDRFMWSWKKSSFVPHLHDNGTLDCHDEPLVIVSREENPNGADVLLMGVPCSVAFVGHFAYAIDFAEAFDDDLLVASRERFKAYRDHGFSVAMRE
jgi:DNA polymerase-3 subunit chi